jgi:hypothetical protein
MRRATPVRITDPGLVLGTIVWWHEDGEQQDFGHMFDITRFTHPGHWGNRQGGGVDEEDFIATQSLYQAGGVSLQTGTGFSDEAHGQGTGAYAMNALNLYLNGEVAAPLNFDYFRFRRPYGEILDNGLEDLTTRLSLQLHVLSDIVGA